MDKSSFRHLRCIIGLFIVILSCRGFGPIDKGLTPQSETSLGSSATLTPTLGEMPVSSITPEMLSTPIATVEWGPQIKSTVLAGLPLLQGNGITNHEGIEDVSVMPLMVMERNIPIWAVFSYGLRTYEPFQPHFVAIYSLKEKSLVEVDRYILECPDILVNDSVTQVEFGDEIVWLKINGYVGAHGGCFDLLKFDGEELNGEISHASDSPLAGEIRDLDQDNIPEVLLNNNMSYVFCYACGVVLTDYILYKWNQGDMVEVLPTLMDEKAPDELRELNNQSVLLAQAELWKDAQTSINQVTSMNPNDDLIHWNAIYINLVADARASSVKEGAYPLLSLMFFGDYPAILDLMRVYPISTLFGKPNPFVAGTVAEGYESQLVGWINEFTSRTITLRPDLAAPYFLRGWAAYLEDSHNESAMKDIEMAVQLAPEERLFAESLSCLRTNCASGTP